MYLEEAIVLETAGPVARVKAVKGEGCGACTPGSCAFGGAEELLLEVDNPVGALVGQRVAIALEAGAILKASLLAYGVPILAAVLGGVAGGLYGAWFAPQQDAELLAFAFGGMAFAAAFLGVRAYDRRPGRHMEFRPRIVRVLE
ncbi:MAG: SoxR reducing system RseC family protein [Nitrospirae bacterium]|nr:SoxR reducing system RseC family protein [Nitrospirota bacterium]